MKKKIFYFVLFSVGVIMIFLCIIFCAWAQEKEEDFLFVLGILILSFLTLLAGFIVIKMNEFDENYFLRR